VLVSADDQIDLRKTLDEPSVVGEREMRHRDEHLRAFALQDWNVARGRGERIVEACVRQLHAADLARRQTEADEADLQSVEGADDVRCGAADRLAGASIDDVRDHPLPARFLHPRDEEVVAEIELVVAERREVEIGGVERCDHLLAFEHGRCDRRRKKIAGEDEERCAAGILQSLLDRRDAREAAGAVDRHGRVDVVDLQEGDGSPRAGRSGFLLLRRRQTVGAELARSPEADARDRDRREQSSHRAAIQPPTSDRSTLPPLRMIPTRLPATGTRPSSAAAAARAPVGSTTSFSRSHK
jgi:hypothetical protein